MSGPPVPDPTLCPEHARPAIAGCLTCERLSCALCLRGVSVEEFLCPECGERGAVLLDEEEFPEPPPSRLEEL